MNHLFNLAMGVTTMDADDCAVLNMLARSEAPAPQNTASSKTEPTVEDYKLSGNNNNNKVYLLNA